MKELKAVIIGKAVIIAGMACGTFIVTFAIAKDTPIELKWTLASGASLSVTAGTSTKMFG
ncbi:MAG TPA: hypothetical protein V6C85_03520 [Allocoleopsis sp.]